MSYRRSTDLLSYIILIGAPIALALGIWQAADRFRYVLLIIIGVGAAAALVTAERMRLLGPRFAYVIGLSTIMILIGLGLVGIRDLTHAGVSFGFAWLLLTLPDR